MSGPTVRHVSAAFNSITSYSTTKAYTVKYAELSKEHPHFATIESPSGLPVRKVVMGDYHAVACDHSGAAFAWGENTAGQLGRGEIGARNVGELAQPMVIEFGRGDEKVVDERPRQRYLGPFPDQAQRTSTGDFKPEFRTRRFVFDVAAGGWQSGALVVDMRDYCIAGNGVADAKSLSRENSPGQDVTQDNSSSSSEETQVATPQMEATSSSQPLAHESVLHPTEIDMAQGNLDVSTENSLRPQHQQGIPIRRGGLPFVRIGFAGRGAVRGGPGFNIPRSS